MQVLTAPGASLETPTLRMRRGTFLLWAGAIALVYLALAFGDASAALPWCDEAWLSNPALTFLRHGYLGTPILTDFGWGPPQSLLHIARRTYWIMPLNMLTQIVWFRAFGYSLLSLRCLSIAWGALALGALGAIVLRATRDARAVLLTLAIGGTDYFYLTRAIDGRMDMMAAALMLCAVALYLWQRETDFDRTVLFTGILAACSFFTHPVGGFFSLCALLFLALYLDRRRLRPRHGVLFSVPFLAIGASWGIYIAQDFPAFRQQMAGNAQGRWAGIGNLYQSVYGELRFKYFQAFGLNQFRAFSLQYLRLIALLSYFAGAIAVACTPALRSRKLIGGLLWITFIFVFGGMLFDGAKRWYYLTYVIPFFVTLLAVWVTWLWDRRVSARPALVAGVVVFIVIQAGGTVYRMVKNDYKNEYLPAVRFVEQHNPRHEPVDGEGDLGFALGFPDYLIDDVSLGYFSHRKAKLIFVPEIYWGLWLDNMQYRDPQVYRHIRYTLSHDYALAYRTPVYRIYERKDERQ